MNAHKLLILLFLFVKLLYSGVVYADIYSNEPDAEMVTLSNIESDEHTILLIAEKLVAEPTLATSNKIAQNLAKNLDSATMQHHAQYQSLVKKAALETQLPTALIHAVIKTESNYNAKAVSKKGAVGLMQLMPATAKQLAVKNTQDANQNVLAGSRYLKKLYDQFGGNLPLALAAYNAGAESVVKYGGKIPPYQETTLYVPKVLAYYQQFRQLN